MQENKEPFVAADRRLLWDACYNAREVGGYPTQQGGEIAWRVLVSTDNLSRLTASGRAALIDYGVRTIIDLRDPSELTMEPHFFTAAIEPVNAPVYYNLPLIRFADEAWQKKVAHDPATPDFYCLTLEHFKPQVAAIMRTFLATSEGSVLVHCHAGKDRTGLVVALLLAVAGVPEQVIAEDYALSNHYLQPWYQQLFVEQAHDPAKQAQLTADFATFAEYMLTVLAYLDQQYGGVYPYLLATGLTEQEIAQIRQRLCPS